jgi:hypothetical protein
LKDRLGIFQGSGRRDERPGDIEKAISTIAKSAARPPCGRPAAVTKSSEPGSAYQGDPLGCSQRATTSDNIVQVLALESLAPSGSLLKLADREIEILRQLAARPGSR